MENHHEGLIDLSVLPSALDLPEAAALIGISRTAACELVRTESWPTPCMSSCPAEGARKRSCGTRTRTAQWQRWRNRGIELHEAVLVAERKLKRAWRQDRTSVPGDGRARL